MKQIIIILACLQSLWLQAQPPNVHITATIKGLEAGKKIYLKDDQRKPVDSTVSFNGGFRLQLYIPPGEGNSYALQIGPRPEYDHTALYLYLEKGKVQITGNGPLFKDVVLSGSPFMQDMEHYNRFVRANRDSFSHASRLVGTARKQENADSVVYWQRRAFKADSILRQLTTQWIATHPSSPISVYLLATRYFYRDIEKQSPLFKQLLPAAINNALGKKMQEQVTGNDLNGIGRLAPGLSLPDTAGSLVQLNNFKGQYVFLDFWASWCVPCRQETPFLKQAMNRYAQNKFAIVSVSIDTDTTKWLKAVHQDDMDWTNLIVSPTKRVNGILHGYFVPSVPTNLLIDPSGRIIARNLRGETLLTKLSQVFK